MRRLIAFGTCLFLIACGPADNDPGEGGVNVEDARALDEAAAEFDRESSSNVGDDKPAEQ